MIKGVMMSGAAAVLALGAAAQADVIAYWAQNNNALPNNPAVFGFTTTAFPQAPDLGAGMLSLQNFDVATTTDATGGDVYYSFIPSFAGNLLNAQPSFTAGGSLSPQGGASNNNLSNNGMSILLQVSTLDYTDIAVSWAQRGTSTGFSSRSFSYSTDGVNFTPVSFAGDSGVLSTSWTLASIDLAAADTLEDQAAVYFKITLDGATSGVGNNRFDNITVMGMPVPEPASMALLALSGLVMFGRRSR